MKELKSLYLTVLIVLSMIRIAPAQLNILSSGIMPINRGDIGIVFWVNAENTGNETLHVTAEMFRCCESIGKLETDCNHMKLVPSSRETLKGGDSVNLDLIYPTLYPHHRKGTCQVDVKGVPAASSVSFPGSSVAAVAPYGGANTPSNTTTSKSAVPSTVITQNITFDTRILLTQIPPLLKDYYSLSEVQWKLEQNVYPSSETEICSSPDEDPLDKCSPVDCAIKYSGTRSFFDLNQRRCLKVPWCLSDPKQELPTVAYLPESNTCRGFESKLSAEDIESFKHGNLAKQSKSNIAKRIKKLRCHKGKEDPKIDSCFCDEGWGTYSTEEDERHPPLPTVKYHGDVEHVPLHMCTVQILAGGPPSIVSLKDLQQIPAKQPVSLDICISFFVQVLFKNILIVFNTAIVHIQTAEYFFL